MTLGGSPLLLILHGLICILRALVLATAEIPFYHRCTILSGPPVESCLGKQLSGAPRSSSALARLTGKWCGRAWAGLVFSTEDYSFRVGWEARVWTRRIPRHAEFTYAIHYRPLKEYPTGKDCSSS